MPSKTKSKSKSKSKGSEMTDLLGKHTMIFVFVNMGMDHMGKHRCGHCATYENDVWNPLMALSNKRVGLMNMTHEQMEASPLAGTPVDGFPSILLLGKDKVPATFKDISGKETVSFPEARNLTVMSDIVSRPPTSENVKTIPTVVKPPVLSNKEMYNSFTSTPFNSKTNARRNKKSTKSVESVVNKGNESDDENEDADTTVTVPNMDKDVTSLDTQKGSPLEFSPNSDPDEVSASGKGAVKGGSLYSTLLNVGSKVAPALLVTASAIALTRKSKRGKKGKKTRKSRR